MLHYAAVFWGGGQPTSTVSLPHTVVLARVCLARCWAHTAWCCLAH